MTILVLQTLFSCGLHHTHLVDLSESWLKECCLMFLGSGGEFLKSSFTLLGSGGEFLKSSFMFLGPGGELPNSFLTHCCFPFMPVSVLMLFIHIFRPYTLMVMTSSFLSFCADSIDDQTAAFSAMEHCTPDIRH